MDGAPPDPRRDALAIEGGRITAIGPTAAIAALAGPDTRRIELSGETVLPGFQDAHIHPISGGLLADQCDLHHLSTLEEYRSAVVAFAAGHPDREWLVGVGWSWPAFPTAPPDRGLLDPLVADRPLILENRDGHAVWVNSRALRLAGIDATTADPPGGRIERDGAGRPTGLLHEGATALVTDLVPSPTHAELCTALAAAQRHLHALGITAWQEAHGTPALLAAYRQAADAGWLTARVEVAQGWEPNGDDDDQIAAFVADRERIGSGRLRAGSVKIFLDGVRENLTAYMVEPYRDADGRAGESRGLALVEPQRLNAVVSELDRLGFNVHFHAIGDGASRQALDAVAAARSPNPAQAATRHHIAHLEVVHPDDIPRFAPLGVAATMQPFWACFDAQMREQLIPSLGPARARWQYPFASLLRAGARLAAGSDWTVTTADPLEEIEVAVRRIAPDTPHEEPLYPEERLSLDEALRAFTIGSAWVNRLDAETGTLEVGKLADLAILDRELRAIPDGMVSDARVSLTMIDGAVVFER
jgi:predicted amidohydrolase YtcJ